MLGFDLKTNCYSKFLYLNLAEEFFFVGSCSRQAFNTFIKRKSDLDSFKCVLIPVVSCDAGIDVIWRVERMRGDPGRGHCHPCFVKGLHNERPAWPG